MSEHLIGTTNNGARVYVELRLENQHDPENPRRYRTTDHRTISDYFTRLSITGCIVDAGESNAWGFGQINDNITADDFTSTTLPPGMIVDLLDMWERYHLNDMKAACVHQDSGAHVAESGHGWKDGQAWDDMMREQTAKCPEGYRYGSAWLVEELPAEVERRARQIQAALTQQPEYTGK